MRTTIILLVSRPEHLTMVFNNLELMDCQHENVNLVTITDGDSNLYNLVKLRTEESKYDQRVSIHYKTKDEMRRHNIGKRRNRIADIHRTIQKHLPESDYIFGIEDDTIIPRNAFRKLTRLMENRSVGLVSGVQVGRWGVPYIGAWQADDIYEPKLLQTKEYRADGLENADATGFYCFLTRYSDYMNHEFKTFENNALGCDVNYGLWLRRQGYKNLIDWGIICGHYNGSGELLLPKPDIPVIKLMKLKTTWRFH